MTLMEDEDEESLHEVQQGGRLYPHAPTPSTLVANQPPQLYLTTHDPTLCKSMPNIAYHSSKSLSLPSNPNSRPRTSIDQFFTLPRHHKPLGVRVSVPPLTKHVQTDDQIELIKNDLTLKRVIPADYRRSTVRYRGDETVNHKNWVPFYLMFHSVETVASPPVDEVHTCICMASVWAISSVHSYNVDVPKCVLSLLNFNHFVYWTKKQHAPSVE